MARVPFKWTRLNTEPIIRRVALLLEDIERYNLPCPPEACKKTDTRYACHVKQFGELAVELDALEPGIILERIRRAIMAELDMDLFQEEQAHYDAELEQLEELREKVVAYTLTA